MAQQPCLRGGAAVANPVVAVIGPQYCRRYPVDLAIVRKKMALTGGIFVITHTQMGKRDY